jgi:hypothetical protein
MQSFSTDARPADGVAGIEWTPPVSRDEADRAILSLSNDIGLILAQLAEDQGAWCDRTGRSPADYAAWKRRALFAKVHKEGQLRECKRVRAQFSSGGAEHEHGRLDRETGELLARSRQVIEVWLGDGAASGSIVLDSALSRLAEHIGRVPFVHGNGDARDLLGTRMRQLAPEGSAS